jgi:adenylate cyclase
MLTGMKPTAKRSLVVLTLCAVVTLVVLYLWQRSFLQEMEFSVQDWQARHGRLTPLDDRLVFIGIDKAPYAADFSEEEIQREPVLLCLQKTWPWSRAVWAKLIEKISEAGAKVVIFDLVLAAPGEGDEELRHALDKYHDRVVIGYNINGANNARGDSLELQLPNENLVPDDGTNSRVTDERLGFVNIWPDSDDTLRAATYRLTGADLSDLLPPEVVLESLDARALRQFGRPDLVPAGFGSRIFRYTSAPGQYDIIRPHPIGDVLSPKLWEVNFENGKLFKDKIVLIGPTAAIFQDLHNTPFSDPKAMAGPETHLQMINAALHGEFLRELPRAASASFIAFAGFIASLLCQFMRAPLKRLLVMGLLGATFALAAKICFDRANLILPIVPPLFVLGFIGIAALAYDFIVERLERMKLRHTMGLYFSPRVMEAVLSDPGSMKPRRAEVVLLLTDLRNSTPLAETLGPKGMFELLNKVFEAQTTAIMGEEGNLEHFLGDQFLSYWGAPQKQPDAADRAIRAAIKLITAMEKLRTTLSPEVQKLFGYGVALHSGSVLVGNKGSALRLDYGLVGDTVNEAARVEALTKYYGAKLLITRDTFAKFNPQSARRLVDRVIVKGKTEPVELYECENPCTPPNYQEICTRYKTAYDEYFFGRFAEAQKQFDTLIQEFSDGPSKALSARCGELLAHPPAKWNGIWKMDAK